jgi:hypothetical protein
VRESRKRRDLSVTNLHQPSTTSKLLQRGTDRVCDDGYLLVYENPPPDSGTTKPGPTFIALASRRPDLEDT